MDRERASASSLKNEVDDEAVSGFEIRKDLNEDITSTSDDQFYKSPFQISYHLSGFCPYTVNSHRCEMLYTEFSYTVFDLCRESQNRDDTRHPRHPPLHRTGGARPTARLLSCSCCFHSIRSLSFSFQKFICINSYCRTHLSPRHRTAHSTWM